MNAESEQVEADQCAGEDKMAAGVYSRTFYAIAASLYSTRSLIDNQCRYLRNGLDELRYDALHTSLTYSLQAITSCVDIGVKSS